MGHPIRGDPLGVVVYVNQACEVNLFYSRSTSFSLNINSHQCPLIVPLTLFCYTRSRLSLGFPFEFRYISVLPPIILRSFSVRSSINLRFPNGE